MNFKKIAAFVVLGFVGTSFAEEIPDELEKLQELFRNKMEREVRPVKGIYLRELSSLERKLLAAGKKEEAAVVTAEKQKWQNGRVVDMKMIQPKPPKVGFPLKKLLPGSVWEYRIESRGKIANQGQMIFLPGGKLNLAVPNGGMGTWKIEGEDKVVFSINPYPPGVITFSKDRMSFSGKADLIERFGALLALPIQK